MADYLEKYLVCPYCGTENLVDLSADIFSSKCHFCDTYFAIVEDDNGIISTIGIDDGEEYE